MAEGEKYNPRDDVRHLKGRGGSGPQSVEHRAKISASLKRYAQRPDSHLHALHPSGEDHPRFKNGTNALFYRKRAFDAYGEACNRCGAVPPTYLVVHHRDDDRQNPDVGNLEVLCMSCHLKHHRGTGVMS